MSTTPSSAVCKCIWWTFSKISVSPKVIHLNRPLRCQACCFPCCLQELEVVIVINNGDVIVIVVLFFLHILPLFTYNGFKSLLLALSSPLPLSRLQSKSSGELSSWLCYRDSRAAMEYPLPKVRGSIKTNLLPKLWFWTIFFWGGG